MTDQTTPATNSPAANINMNVTDIKPRERKKQIPVYFDRVHRNLARQLAQRFTKGNLNALIEMMVENGAASVGITYQAEHDVR